MNLAGAYLREYAGAAFATPVAYLAELTDTQLLDHPSLTGEIEGYSPTGHDGHVGQTFPTSVDRLDPEDPFDAMALRVLGRAAALAPGEAIPHDLMQDDAEVDADIAQQRAVHDAINRTIRLGLLNGRGSTAFTLHRLVGHYVRAQVPTAKDDRDTVIGRVNSRAYEINTTGLPAPMAPYLQHLRHLAEESARAGTGDDGTIFNNLGYHLGMIADFNGAKAAFERALRIFEKSLGHDHHDTAVVRRNLDSLR